MTKHRKILEGVSEGPLHFKPLLNPGECRLVYSPKSMYHIANFDDEADAKLFVHARNHWESICDLIDAVEEYRKADEETNKCTELLVFDPCTPKAAEIMQAMYKAKDELFAALDKLNGQEEK